MFLFLASVQLALSVDSSRSDPYGAVTDKLQALTRVQLSDCRWHSDVAHPEETSLDDSSWQQVAVGETFKSGTHDLRCWFTVPKLVHGYDISNSSLKVALDFQGDGMTMLSVYSNAYNVYRGNVDTLEPVAITPRAESGQRFLIAVRLEVGDQPRKLSRSEVLIQPSTSRPDPEWLWLQIQSLAPIVNAYPDQQRQSLLASAAGAIDFSKLDSGDQAGFDASLNAAEAKLRGLSEWVRHFRIRAVGNSHIDMAWLWPWTETVGLVHDTFRSALNFMHEYPDFKFTASTARAYEWMEEKYPDLFHEIQQRVKEGRWEIVGGMWVEPDLNMPSGESLTRQILIGKQYFKQKFDVDVRIGWNPDSFGYNWQLPQIYKKSGIDYFVTQKLLWAHEFTTFPYKLFWWESPDGSRLLTYFPHDYGSLMEPIPMAEDVSTWTPSMYGPDAKDPVMMYLYGVGDHGGGPTRTMLDQARQLMAPDAVFPKVDFSTASAFFSDLEQRSDLKIPSWKNELYFQYHRGVFTTQSETKRLVRQAEETLLDAEKYATLARLYGRAYPRDEFTTAWKGLLFDQFHDIMPGSGIAVNYLDAKRDLTAVAHAAGDVLGQSLEEISSHIDTTGTGVPIVVFNSLSWPRKEVLEVEAQLPEPAAHIEVTDAAGKPVPSQILSWDRGTNRARLLVQASVPAVGYAVLFVRQIEKSTEQSELKSANDSLENELVRVTVDPQTGCITSLLDKRSGKESLAPSETDTGGPKDKPCGNLLQAFVDKPKEYDAWNIDADFENQFWNLDKADEVTLTESGPLRAVIRVKKHFQNSSFIQDITLYPGTERVDVNMQADWDEKHILLKVAFPANVHAQKATYEIPFGSIERPTTRLTPEEHAQFEVPAEHWADLSDATHGLSLLNDSKYGYDAKGNVLRLSLLRSPSWPDPHADEGHHKFTYSIYPHQGTWRDAETVRRGYELNYKLSWRQVQNHAGVLPKIHSFVEVDSPNVVLTAIKTAENDDSMILRFYEWAGKESDVKLRVPTSARTTTETNLIEQQLGSLPIEHDTITVHTKPYEIKTVAVSFSASPH